MIGLVTIGQSPRPDVVASMFNEPMRSRLLEAGALDGMTESEILRLMPRDGDYPLVTRLRDGREVNVGKPSLLPYLQAAINRVVDAGADVVVVLCTGEFPTLVSSAQLVFPDRLLFHAVEAILPRGRLGVLMPHGGQRDMMIRKWTTPSRSVLTGSASPYTSHGSFGAIARNLVADGSDLIVMDCMGFDRAMLDTVRRAVAIPVLLANDVVGAFVAQITDSFKPAQMSGAV